MRKMTLVRNRNKLVLAAGCVLVWLCLRWTFFPGYQAVPPTSERDGSGPLQQSATPCKRPELDMNDAEIMRHFHPATPLDCDEVDDWVCVKGPVARLCNATARWHPRPQDVTCRFRFLRRVDDFLQEEMGTAELNGDQVVDLLSDVFHVTCTELRPDGGEPVTWQNLMRGVAHNPKVWARTGFEHLPPEALRMNFLMWGYDSLSRMTFMRKLPLTYRYLTEELGAVVLKGYNIVGDGTPQALIPVLTGRTERELPETRKRMVLTANHVDVYPFIWNDFARMGYVTAYTEDGSSIGTFTYRLKGFNKQPTDHYLRPFYLELDKLMSQHRKFCLAGTPRHKVLMDWVEDFFDYYSSKPKFMFAFHSELSHDDINSVELADADNLKMLQSLKRKGHLDNTLLVILCDHGHRFAQVRETQQGKQEERMPFVAVVVPESFKRKYPKAYANLVINGDRLTSPFDVYPTIASLLYSIDGPIPGDVLPIRSVSLFQEVPRLRTCADADIEPHWCTCLNWGKLNVNSTIVQRAAAAFVEVINNKTHEWRHLCHELIIKEVVWAERYAPNIALLSFKKNADYDGFVGDFSDTTKVKEEFYQFKVVTQPGDAHFEATVRHNVPEDRLIADTKELSRVNLYGHAPDCIIAVNTDLLRFCYCKNQSAAAAAAT